MTHSPEPNACEPATPWQVCLFVGTTGSAPHWCRTRTHPKATQSPQTPQTCRRIGPLLQPPDGNGELTGGFDGGGHADGGRRDIEPRIEHEEEGGGDHRLIAVEGDAEGGSERLRRGRASSVVDRKRGGNGAV